MDSSVNYIAFYLNIHIFPRVPHCFLPSQSEPENYKNDLNIGLLILVLFAMHLKRTDCK